MITYKLTAAQEFSSVPPAAFIRYLPAGHFEHSYEPEPEYQPIVHCRHQYNEPTLCYE